jgi:glycerol-3-phosphate acyltransferase PlsX
VIVAVDAMGGDHAPAVVVDGAIAAIAEHDLTVALVGQRKQIEAELARHPAVDGSRLRIVEAPDFILMDDAPLAALRRKPQASIRVAANLVASGGADALFSAGHTGAAFLAAHATLGMIDGVERPALAVTVPTPTGAAILLDAGANVECRPEHLEQFARLGSAYARVALGLERPRVGLLSIGEEAGKGNELIREAHARLVHAPIDFIGNLEAREFFTGRADVIVCDGFTGNIALKVGEGLVEAVEAMLREELGAELVSQLGALLTRRAFARFKRRVDYAASGGAPLLGVGGIVLVGHGRSSAKAIKNGIALAAKLAREGALAKLTTALQLTTNN